VAGRAEGRAEQEEEGRREARDRQVTRRSEEEEDATGERELDNASLTMRQVTRSRVRGVLIYTQDASFPPTPTNIFQPKNSDKF
jgi:hypothetical protein